MLLGSGLEAIAFQRTRPAFKLLTAEIQSLMDQMAVDKVTMLTDTMLNKSKLSRIMQEVSGFSKLTLVVEKRAAVDAWTNTLLISNMHVFHDNWRRQFIGNADAFNLFRQCNNVLTGQIDLVTGVVSGDFSKVPVTIGLGYGMLDPQFNFTAEEIAATLLHELGHNFTYMYTIHYTCTTNMVLLLAAKALAAAEDNKAKYAIMSDVQNTLGIKIDNQPELTNYNRYENYYITMLGLYRKKVYDTLGADAYNTNMSEQLADMYAARHGASAALVTGLNKMNKMFDMGQTEKRLAKIQSVFAFITLFPVAVPLFLIGVYCNDFVSGTYDLDKDRFIRIRNEATASLKDPNLTADEKKTILTEIDTMNAIIKETDNAWSFAEKAAYLLRASQRQPMRQKRLLQDLEALTNNPLYVAAAKYSV